MTDRTLLRLAALAAVIGGGLRISAGLVPAMMDAPSRELLYFTVDALLIAGLMGLYLDRSRELGWSGILGFAIAVLGLLIVRSAQMRVFGIGGYAVGAPVALIGTTLLGVSLALRGTQRWAAGLWLASLAIGHAASFGAGESWIPLAAGILFGAGFVAAGFALLSPGRAAAKAYAVAQSAQTVISTVTWLRSGCCLRSAALTCSDEISSGQTSDTIRL